jgi:hypothetical protein
MEAEVVVPATPEATPGVAPQADVTATPAAPTGGLEPAKAPEPPRMFTQEELDAAISKRLGREERKWQREADRRVAEIARTPPPAPTQTPTKPQPDQYATTELYVEALAEFKAKEIYTRHAEDTEKQARERQAREQADSARREYEERVTTALEKYPDYHDVVGNPSLPISEHMAQTIAYSEQGPDLAYYLGQNPQEAARIYHLAPFLQAKELGRIEAKLASAPPPVKTSNAPPPIKPVSGKAPVASDNPSDNDDIDTWVKKRNRQVYGGRN